MSPPLVVVEGSGRAYAVAITDARDAGWALAEGWRQRGTRVVCTGRVTSADDAVEALLAAVAGTGLIVDARAPRDVIDRLCDDLRRLGRLDHRVGDEDPYPRLTRDERALVLLLSEGVTLSEAARRSSISRRTADRRLASVRDKLGVQTTAEALVRLAGGARP